MNKEFFEHLFLIVSTIGFTVSIIVILIGFFLRMFYNPRTTNTGVFSLQLLISGGIMLVISLILWSFSHSDPASLSKKHYVGVVVQEKQNIK